MDIVTFGETMIAMNPMGEGSLEGVTRFEKRMAGSESNVAIGLARLGHQVAWVSRLGQDGFGHFIHRTLEAEAVDVSRVVFDDTRPTGVYFKEHLGHGKTAVYYYRSNSAASRLLPQDVDLTAYPDARYLFVSGITPALNATCREATMRVIEQAHRRGMTVVFDPNIRLKLWSADEARPVLCEIAKLSDVVLPGLEEGRIMTGLTNETDIAERLLQGRTKLVVIKLGAAGAYYRTPAEARYVTGYPVDQVDEIGAGDAFAAGCVSGLLDGLDVSQAVQRACALGAIAVTSVGDYESLPTRQDLERFMKHSAENHQD
jgi:2-dehydro-3-deoxygluconokinase